MTEKRLFYASLAVHTLAMFYLLARTAHAGRFDYVIAFTLMASPIPMAASAVCYERLPSEKDGYRRLAEVFNPKFASWAFLFGDMIALPAAMVFAARNWAAHDTHPGWATAWWWAVASLLLGFFAGVVFHYLDGKRYIKSGHASALYSPTKQVHDRCAWTVLAGASMYLGLPAYFQPDPNTVVMSVALSAWLLLNVIDQLRGLDLTKLHPAWDRRKFAVAA